MKKTYLNPELVVVKLQTAKMLAASENIDINSNPVDEGTPGDARDGDFDED